MSALPVPDETSGYEPADLRVVIDGRTGKKVILRGWILGAQGRRIFADILTSSSLRRPDELREVET